MDKEIKDTLDEAMGKEFEDKACDGKSDKKKTKPVKHDPELRQWVLDMIG